MVLSDLRVVDVDTKTGMTRIVVQSGSAVVYGEKGEALEVKSGQRVSFRERVSCRRRRSGVLDAKTP